MTIGRAPEGLSCRDVPHPGAIAREMSGSLDLGLPRRERRGMAQLRTTSVRDGQTGSAAVESVRFGFAGPELEIDLSAEHAATLRSLLAPYITRARRVR